MTHHYVDRISSLASTIAVATVPCRRVCITPLDASRADRHPAGFAVSTLWLQGFIDHFWCNYVRYDGLINYRAEEVAQQARMLTILALYRSYTGGTDDALLLAHFGRAKAMADWLVARRTASLQYESDDPRHGILGGQDEGDNFKTQYKHNQPVSHFYSANAEVYRAFAELGPVWVAVGASANRSDVTAHGEVLLKLPPLLYRDLHISLNKTANMTQVCACPVLHRFMLRWLLPWRTLRHRLCTTVRRSATQANAG